MNAVQPSLKYAHVEREQRFLLAALPAEVTSLAARTIRDRYLCGTRLRLRVIEQPGDVPILKLGQKIPMAGEPPMAVAHTTMYLDRADYDALVVVPAQELRKTRRLAELGETTFVVDEFHDQLAGLVLAEVDLGQGGPPLATLPIPSVAEVTTDERFAGGALAALTSDALSELLGEFAL
jgi:CYTH domain-containing protein